MRQLLRGKPGTILMVGLLLMACGFCTTYFLLAIAYGGFLHEPTVVKALGFGLTGGAFFTGVALVIVSGYRRCKSLRSS